MLRLLGALSLVAVWLLSVAATPPTTGSPAPAPSASSTAVATPTPTPVPTPTPNSSGQLALSVTLGPPGTVITVSGTAFRPGESVTLYWDDSKKSLGQVTADGQGGFKLDVQAPASDPGQHLVCAVEPNQTCAVFKLEAAPTPSPSASATASPSPAATAGGVGAASSPAPGQASPAGSTGQTSAVAALLQPPFVIFPALLLLALLGACAYWIWFGRRPRPAAAHPAPRVLHTSVYPSVTRPAAVEDAPSPHPDPAPKPAPTLPLSPRELPAPRPSADDTIDLPTPGD